MSSRILPIDSIDSGTLYFYNGDTVVFKLVEQNEWTLHGLKMKGNLWSLKNYAKESIFKYTLNNKDQVFYTQKPFEKNPMTGVIRWRYTDESPDKFGWPNYGRILKTNGRKRTR